MKMSMDVLPRLRWTIDENPGIIKVGCADGKVGMKYAILSVSAKYLTVSTQFTIAFNLNHYNTPGQNLDPVFGDVNSAIRTNRNR